MKRIPINDLVALVNSAINKQQAYLKFANDKSNPQIVESRISASGKLKALEAVKLALQGNDSELRIIAGEFQC